MCHITFSVKKLITFKTPIISIKHVLQRTFKKKNDYYYFFLIRCINIIVILIYLSCQNLRIIKCSQIYYINTYVKFMLYATGWTILCYIDVCQFQFFILKQYLFLISWRQDFNSGAFWSTNNKNKVGNQMSNPNLRSRFIKVPLPFIFIVTFTPQSICFLSYKSVYIYLTISAYTFHHFVSFQGRILREFMGFTLFLNCLQQLINIFISKCKVTNDHSVYCLE